ncbi:tRNA3(Ser)-specific nuclease WapA precursor [Nonomuraea coxensis DSM 45129]|uniref:tRNA3(Ser)-specific nuclease WapA n=1 Tax=Nonomuraea coxensis DSM 45129 TaxID=1122611 RepID=A0ABX8TZR7_9ACTN|nr:tRNA3(Ser)-specific nuclease WapA precursor [Nonomuraea coxensis DSM 45129]
MWARPVRVKKNAAWAWIDPTLSEQGGVVKPQVIKGDLALSSGGDAAITTYTLQEGRSLSLTWPTTLPQPVLDGSHATYPDAAGPGADLVVTALATGFRYDVVLRTRPAKAWKLKIPFQGKGLSLRETSDGVMRVADASGLSVAVNSPPTLRSAKGGRKPATNPGIGVVETSVEESGAQQMLQLKPDLGFLADPATQYPVTLQSAFSMTAASDADVWSVNPDDPNGSGLTLKAGTEADGAKSRAYLKFDTSPLVGQQISNVTLSLLNIDGPSCGSRVSDGIQVRQVTSGWSPATVTWATQPTNTTANAVTNLSSVGGSCEPTPMTWDITAVAKQWAADVGNYGLVLMSPTERAVRNYRVYPSSENSDFNDPPKLTATFSPIDGPVVVSPAGADGVEVIQAPANWLYNSPQMAEPQAHALSAAYDRVKANADKLADPYVDMVTGQVIVPAATADGHTVGSAVLSGTAYLGYGGTDWTLPGEYTDGDTDEDEEGPPGPTEPYNFTPQVPDVTTSYGRNAAIAREVLQLTSAQLPGADALVSARPWAERNKVLITANAVSPELRLALAQRYGVDSVVIRLKPDATSLQTQAGMDSPPSMAQAGTDTRANDNDAYINGGGAFEDRDGHTCTVGFAWSLPAGRRLVTAGHCLPANISTGDAMFTPGGTREFGKKVLSTWNAGKGTVFLPGKNESQGDSALASPNASIYPTASIFIGGPESGKKKEVKRSWQRRSIPGDLFCIGGAVYGQHCSWKVIQSEDYFKTDGGLLDNAIGGTHPSECLNEDGGDSGGPVYTFQPDGSVVAKGIVSSGTSTLLDCYVAFTDITTLRESYGGDVMKRK